MRQATLPTWRLTVIDFTGFLSRLTITDSHTWDPYISYLKQPITEWQPIATDTSASPTDELLELLRNDP